MKMKSRTKNILELGTALESEYRYAERIVRFQVRCPSVVLKSGSVM